ncbi:hypothetical protein QR680_011065 [Steinernema hermaphroditum]|uniref:Uncharacterized protein n=1 Tax=Steinernema hermaphroditum TaxID=289476 RepID=A0AA39IQZ6_9BILA|nr:hypothetical protein QR680_011065 [Steinernema hermaphroditum]
MLFRSVLLPFLICQSVYCLNLTSDISQDNTAKEDKDDDAYNALIFWIIAVIAFFGFLSICLLVAPDIRRPPRRNYEPLDDTYDDYFP